LGKQHPEGGLAFEPEGHGFTTSVTDVPWVAPHNLLSGRVIASVRRNHRDDWQDAFAALPSRQRDPRTGRFTSGFTDDERERLATLAILIDHGLFRDDDGSVTEGERSIP
jgi:hypothetical protein